MRRYFPSAHVTTFSLFVHKSEGAMHIIAAILIYYVSFRAVSVRASEVSNVIYYIARCKVIWLNLELTTIGSIITSAFEIIKMYQDGLI